MPQIAEFQITGRFKQIAGSTNQHQWTNLIFFYIYSIDIFISSTYIDLNTNLVRVYLEKSSETRVTVFILANDVRVM